MSFLIEPIGIIRTPYTDKYAAPRQPSAAPGQGDEGLITLFPHRNFEQALQDLEGFERIWIVSWFHYNQTWKPKVMPPRSVVKRGVFATRSPHRPNPVGISVCRLLQIKGLTLRVADPDLLDNTPVLDIKPYLPYADAFAGSRTGWLETLDESLYDLELLPATADRLTWLKHRGVDLQAGIETVLRRHPLPHPYRRTKLRNDGTCELAMKDWRVIYRVEGQTVTVEDIRSGYQGDEDDAPLHTEFRNRWG